MRFLCINVIVADGFRGLPEQCIDARAFPVGGGGFDFTLNIQMHGPTEEVFVV